MDDSSLTLKDLQVHKALRAWHDTESTSENLLTQLLLVKKEQVVVDVGSNPNSARLATNQVLLDGIERLAVQNDENAKILRTRFLDKETILATAYQFNLSPDQLNRRQRVAIRQLTQILLELETAARKEHAQVIEVQLPPPSYTQLFGLDHAKSTLIERLLSQEPPWIVNIMGIGGIGKTALADALTRQILNYFHFTEIIWVRAESHSMSGTSLSPRLIYENLMTELADKLLPKGGSPEERTKQVHRRLKGSPHLVVVDNLEAEDDMIYLLEQLGGLVASTKFLLTSRVQPSGQIDIFNFSVDELVFDDVAALIHHHAETLGITNLDATAADIASIYELTGGNPLALKLTVSLASVLPLSQILTDLANARSEKIEDMYRHIYWNAWRTLTPHARMLLQAMPLVAQSGALPDQMKMFSQLDDDLFWSAIMELSSRSLLEVRGTVKERRYGIHRLTETFLSTEINHWSEVHR